MFHEKVVRENGAMIEVKIWKVPLSKKNPEGMKYSLVYIVGGERVVVYDNSEGEGPERTEPTVDYDNIRLEIAV